MPERFYSDARIKFNWLSRIIAWARAVERKRKGEQQSSIFRFDFFELPRPLRNSTSTKSHCDLMIFDIPNCVIWYDIFTWFESIGKSRREREDDILFRSDWFSFRFSGWDWTINASWGDDDVRRLSHEYIETYWIFYCSRCCLVSCCTWRPIVAISSKKYKFLLCQSIAIADRKFAVDWGPKESYDDENTRTLFTFLIKKIISI